VNGLSQEATEFYRLLAKQSTDTAGRVLILYGTSGAGKTRTIYETFCCDFGLYFTASVAGNGGSTDFGVYMSYVEQADEKVKKKKLLLEVSRH